MFQTLSWTSVYVQNSRVLNINYIATCIFVEN